MKKMGMVFKKGHVFILGSFILTALFLSSNVEGETKVPVFESGFESEVEVKEKFQFDKIEDHAWQVTSDGKHFGMKGLKITVNKGDKLAKKTERSEIQDPLKIPLDEEAWYRIDFKIPKDFPEIDNRLVIWQLKQSGKDNPLIAMNYINGELRLKQRFDLNQINYYQVKKDIKDKWIRIVVHAKASHSESGFIDVYLDNTQIIQYKGQTAHHNKWEENTYFKFGLYRDVIDMPMYMYFDQYIRGASWNDVVPENKNAELVKNLWRIKEKKKKK